MDYFANPALLSGGMISAAMLAGWALGRWQASPPEPANIPDAAPSPRSLRTAQATPNLRIAGPLFCQPQTSSRGASVFDNAISLTDLHEEISALRRSEQVFATLAPDAVMLDQFAKGANRAPVADAIASGPASSAHYAAEPGCSCGRNCDGYLRTTAAAQAATPQPSPGWSAFARV